MKMLLASLFVAFATVVVWAADTASIAGTWKVHNSIAGNESDQDCTFTEEGKDLKGTCSLEQGSAEVKGNIGDASITWQFQTEWNGSQLTLLYTGTLDKDSKISGTVEVQPMSVAGDFTATRSK